MSAYGLLGTLINKIPEIKDLETFDIVYSKENLVGIAAQITQEDMYNISNSQQWHQYKIPAQLSKPEDKEITAAYLQRKSGLDINCHNHF